jgi:hypothetical protein
MPPADPDLMRVMAAWPAVPESMRKAIVAMAEAAVDKRA